MYTRKETRDIKKAKEANNPKLVRSLEVRGHLRVFTEKVVKCTHLFKSLALYGFGTSFPKLKWVG